MKLLVVCQYYHPEPFRIADICEGLAGRGHEVTVLTGLPNYPEGVRYPGYKPGSQDINGVRIIRVFQFARGKGIIGRILNYFSFALFAGVKAGKLDGFDAVLCHQLSPVMMDWPAARYAGKRGAPHILYCLDLWPASLTAGGVSEGSFLYRVFDKISRKTYEKADKILVSSEQFMDYFRDELQIKDKPVFHLPQYAEELFEMEGVDPIESPFEHNVVFAGNIGDVQSVDTIIKAAGLLANIETDPDNQINPEIGFHIVGEGSALQKCKDLAEELVLKNVTFYGRRPVEEMPSFYKMADAMLVTLKDQGALSATLPGKVQSCMAAGRPVIGAISGEGARVINESGCGIAVPPEDERALAAAVVALLEFEDREELGKKGREYYDANFSREKFLDKLEEEIIMQK